MRPINFPSHVFLRAAIALVLSSCLSASAGAAGDGAASAQLNVGETRGALLYSTYCNACHTSKIYWRDKKLVTDMGSLKFQVRRWQDIIGLTWTEDEVADVAGYLNAVFYGFPATEQKSFLEEGKPLHAQRGN